MESITEIDEVLPPESAENQETNQKSKEETRPVRPSPVAVDRGALVPNNAVELSATINQIALGGGFPKRFDTKEKRLAAYNLANQLGGKRWQLCLNNIANIHGQLTIFGDLPGSLAEWTGQVKEKKIFLITKDYIEICVKNKNLDAEPWAGVCHIQRKGRELKEFFYTVEDAKRAGQIPAMKWLYQDGKRTKQIENEDSPWVKHFPIMLMRKALNLGVNFEFADAKCGVPVAEYDHDEIYEEREVKDTLDEVEDHRSKIANLA